MRFDVYGRFELVVERRDDRWVVLRPGHGTNRVDPSLVLPPDAPAEEVARHLEDLLHELGEPGRRLRRIG